MSLKEGEMMMRHFLRRTRWRKDASNSLLLLMLFWSFTPLHRLAAEEALYARRYVLRETGVGVKIAVMVELRRLQKGTYGVQISMLQHPGVELSIDTQGKLDERNHICGSFENDGFGNSGDFCLVLEREPGYMRLELTLNEKRDKAAARQYGNYSLKSDR